MLIRREYERAFSKYDVIIGPATPTTACKFEEKRSNPLEMCLEDIFTVSDNKTGLPALVIPCGFDNNGLRIGFQITGKDFGEVLYLRWVTTSSRILSSFRRNIWPG